jgi:hypothetical protein
VGIAWFFLWLGVALLGLSGVVAIIWHRHWRLRGIVTLSVALLLAGLAVQQILLAVAAATGIARWTSTHS